MVFGDPAELAAYQALVDAFRAAHPEVHVELRHVASQGDYQKQLVTAFSAKAEPDVMLLNHRRMAQFAAQGGLEPLGGYLAESRVLDAAGFYPQALEAFTWEGETWCIPQNVSSLVVYYNRALFDEAGVAYPSGTWSWEQFVETARALTRDKDGDGQIDQYGVGMDLGLMRLAPFIWQNGGELLDDASKPTRLALDTPAALEAFRWLVDLQVVHHVAPDAAAEQAEASENRFMSGSLAMYLNSRRGVPTYRTVAGLDWDVAPLPQGKQPAGILHSDGYCLSARAKDKASAWTLIEFANSAEGQTIVAGTGRTVPSLRSVAESAAFLDPGTAPASSRVFLDALPLLRRMPNLPNWPAIEETASREIERAFYGQASVEEAAAAAVSATLTFFESKDP
jgi:multiple sugar transport system substrate-binding protein